MRARRIPVFVWSAAIATTLALGVPSSPAGASVRSGDKPSQAETRKAFLAFARCMREHGVDMPDPKVTSGEGGGTLIEVGGPGQGSGERGPDPESPTFKRAEKACHKYIKDVTDSAPGKGDPEQEKAMRRSAVKFARCMRSEGIDFPDPQFEGGGVTQRLPRSAAESPRFEAAQRRCAKKVGGPVIGKAGGPGPALDAR
jgi:hypothetical protein